MYIVPSCLDVEARQGACPYCICKATVALRCGPSITHGSYLPATNTCFGVFGYKYYVVCITSGILLHALQEALRYCRYCILHIAFIWGLKLPMNLGQECRLAD